MSPNPSFEHELSQLVSKHRGRVSDEKLQQKLELYVEYVEATNETYSEP